MISKEYLKNINPNKNIYNAKYSEGTYKFLNENQNRDIKIYWKKKDTDTDEITKLNNNIGRIYPTRMYFIYEINGDFIGTTWSNIMQNKYTVYNHINFDKNDFEDITDWFLNEYLKIGRCMFDEVHSNFLLGKNKNYVTEEERFEIINGKKTCKWCGLWREL